METKDGGSNPPTPQTRQSSKQTNCSVAVERWPPPAEDAPSARRTTNRIEIEREREREDDDKDEAKSTERASEKTDLLVKHGRVLELHECRYLSAFLRMLVKQRKTEI
ncbi:hypothetical protein ACJRO7_004396 [Eucalyptus globulus]|uniref:Uncharacterized protein n=1 Tax=Eucalyptus globulus TaxID=34317 RepID=A0ABD3IZY1_EUCGL